MLNIASIIAPLSSSIETFNYNNKIIKSLQSLQITTSCVASKHAPPCLHMRHIAQVLSFGQFCVFNFRQNFCLYLFNFFSMCLLFFFCCTCEFPSPHKFIWEILDKGLSIKPFSPQSLVAFGFMALGSYSLALKILFSRWAQVVIQVHGFLFQFC